jgi:hypothetical protein
MESATKNYNNTEYKMSLRWGRFMVFNATFNNISVIIVAIINKIYTCARNTILLNLIINGAIYAMYLSAILSMFS